MSDLENLLNTGLMSNENGISPETRDLLIDSNFSQVVNYQEDTFTVSYTHLTLPTIYSV